MARSVSFAHAVRLLGGHNSKLLSAIDTAAGWLMVGAAPLAGEVLSWFDHKADLSRLSQEAVRGFYELQSGLSKYNRAERIEAAHTVIVIAAFFDGLKEVRLPTKLTRAGQIAIGTGGAAMSGKFVTQIMSAGRLLPDEGQAPEDFEQGLRGYYRNMVDEVNEHLDGLAVARNLSRAERRRITEALGVVADRALGCYRNSMLELANFPDFVFWAQRQEHRATRVGISEVRDDIVELRAMLRDRYAGQAPDEQRARLAKAHLEDLRTRTTGVGPLPNGVRVPALDELYLTRRIRVMDVTAPDQVSEESRWASQECRDDPWQFLGDHLQSDRAARAPLFLVGDTGSGKTAFLRMGCALLPAERFLVVRIDLRRKPELVEIQDHIEEAMRAATGESLNWPSLTPPGREIQRVVALDSFDEFLQATGADQADLLERVAEFQRRESIQGRPVAVVVTSRTATADQARIPEGTLAIRLEPFGEPQIRDWIACWNSINPEASLTVEAILTHGDLAEQPLLLLLLAVHAAGLRPAGGPYEHVLGLLAAREVAKYRPQLHRRESTVETDLGMLAEAALASFNRGDRWISEADLHCALNNVERAWPLALPPTDYVLARFPFRRRGQGYAFTYSAFADVLVARLIWNELRKIENADYSVPVAGISDEDLRGLLSTQTLGRRRTVIDFLTDMMTELRPSASRKIKDLLVRMFRAVRSSPAQHEFRRTLIYRANLLQLLVCAPTENVRASELFPDPLDPIAEWRAQAMLWESQLSPENRQSLIDAITVERIEENGVRDIRLGPAHDGWAPGAIDPAWSSGRPSADPAASGLNWTDLRRRANFRCDPADDIMLHAVEPLFRHFDGTGWLTSATALLTLWTAPSPEAYQRCAHIAISESWAPSAQVQFLELLLPHLSAPGHIGAGEAAEILHRLDESLRPYLTPQLRSKMVECLLTHLDRGESGHDVAHVLGAMLIPDLEGVDTAVAALALIRLFESSFPRPAVRQLASQQNFDALVSNVGAERPSLVKRLAQLAPEAARHDGKAG
ncbi:NACHT domain-containing protein [Amycolatopsis sp. RTGN1]|uniref:NACHT domain-containing protein n=1 Tax=Amycolatopsis ponsaeliensis TaxID=2992142 RepID=UPI002550551B|nr:hypothetical protein [Amycolatopsis sp. RTGN1]